MSRVVYRVLAEDGIQNQATGQRWRRWGLLEGSAITSKWAKALLAEGAIERVKLVKHEGGLIEIVVPVETEEAGE